MAVYIEPGMKQLVLFEHVKQLCGYGSAMKLEQYDKDIYGWVVVKADEVEPEDGAKFRVVCVCQVHSIIFISTFWYYLRVSNG